MRIAALYQFKPVTDTEAVKTLLEAKTREHGIVGMLMLATEGINGTIAGEEESLQSFLDFLIHDLDFNKLELKFSQYESKAFTEDALSPESPFYRMRISVRKEIVTMGVPNVDMRLLETNPDEKIQFVPAREWNNLLEKPNVLVVDTRNDYEYDVGSFDNALNPHTKTFRDFPAYIDQLITQNRTKTENTAEKPDLAIFCTGGIRCEKASVYLSQLPHFNKIYQLHGGILRYLEEVPEEESRWKGECFVFDQRVSVKHGLQAGSYSLCRGCRHPLTPEDLTEDSHFLEGVHCRYCYDSLSEKQVEALKERQKQMRLAKERQTKHLGGNYSTPKRRNRRQQQRPLKIDIHHPPTSPSSEDKEAEEAEEEEEDEVDLSESFLHRIE